MTDILEVPVFAPPAPPKKPSHLAWKIIAGAAVIVVAAVAFAPKSATPTAAGIGSSAVESLDTPETTRATVADVSDADMAQLIVDAIWRVQGPALCDTFNEALDAGLSRASVTDVALGAFQRSYDGDYKYEVVQAVSHKLEDC